MQGAEAAGTKLELRDSQAGTTPGNDSAGKASAAAETPVRAAADDLSALAPATGTAGSVQVSVEVASVAPLETHGISAANQSMTMNQPEKTNKVAGLAGKTEKVLPGVASLVLPGNNLPVSDPHGPTSPFNASSMLVNGAPGNGANPVMASAPDGVLAASVINLHSRAVERTHDMVALHAMRLVDAKTDSLSVVIKPGAGMQLSLEMRQHGDGIDIQAVLQRGDFEHLSQHWPELQQRLEQRGIRLAPLTGGDNTLAGGGANGFEQAHREFASADPLEASAFAAFALAGPAMAPSTPATAPAVMLHGWETWA